MTNAENKITRILVIFLLATSASLSIHAQDWSWMEDAPRKYVGANTARIISSGSECNRNGEAFKDFIPRFRTDKAFRESRIRLDADDEAGASTLKYFDNFKLLKASHRNTRCDKSYGTWYNVSADQVCFHYSDVLLCSEAGGGSVSARFQRIGGKWYCTGFMAAG